MSSQILLSAPGGQEWLLIFLIVLVLFGAKRLPEVARGLGSGIREFKKAMRDDPTPPESPGASATPAKPDVSPGAENKSGQV